MVLATIAFSSFITLLTTSYQLYSDYKNDIAAIDGYFELIKDSYLESLTTSVWMYDEKQISAQLDGLIKIPDMEHLGIKAGDDHFWSSGSLRAKHKITHHFPLVFKHRNKEFEIGMLSATASLDKVYNRLIGKAFSILISNAVRAFFVSCFILFIFHLLVTRRLIRLSRIVENIDIKKYPIEIEIKKSKRKKSIDEIDQVVYALGKTQQKLFASYEELKQSQDELFQIFTMSIDLICIANINTLTFVKVNPAFIDTLGFSEKELLSKSFMEFIHPDDVLSTQRVVDEDLKAGKTVLNFENRYICKDGSYRWFRWVSHPQPEKGITYAIAHDVTVLKQSVKELEESHQRFLTILDAIDAHIYVADMETYEILFMNSKMQKDFGGDKTGDICYHAFRKNSEPCECCTNDRLVDKHGSPAGVRIWDDKNPVTGRYYINYDRAIEWIDGRLVRMQIATDITDLKKMEAQLNQAQKMESVGRLAGGVAHDFNNMLGVILGHTELALLQADETHDLHADLNEIQNAAKRSADLVKKLLAFARKQTISPRQLDLNNTVESMLNMLRRLIGEDIDLVWQPGAHLWPVKMDPSQIDQILANLCVNARDAISGVGKLTIETGIKSLDEEYCKEHPGFIPGDFVLLAVSDNGCGMEKDTLANLFEPFFTTKEVGKGTGLGLATVYGIVKQNNGFINVYSEPGQGSTFRIFLPRLVVDEDTDKAVPDKKAAAGGTETILLVEDETSILRMTRMMLERKGYSVLPAATPAEAVEKATNHSGAIDLLMSDVVMPEMNGRDLAAQIIGLCPGIRLLFMSGYTANVIAHHGVLDAGVAFIQKPFSMADLMVKVREVLDKESDSFFFDRN
ncbi:MAG: PAS domain S-box protein [Desulfotignum sp.]|nr:PAS domain S-box protein [Desulfotignum sp.]